MSESAAAVETEVPEVVVSRSQYASKMHRADPEADNPQPACPQADADAHDRYRRVARAAISQVYTECSNPECFGGDWR